MVLSPINSNYGPEKLWPPSIYHPWPPSIYHPWPPSIYHPFTIHLPSFKHPFTIHLPSIYHPFTIHLPSFKHPFTIHLPSIYHPFTIHLPSFKHPFTIHLPSIYHPLNIHLPSIYHPLNICPKLQTSKPCQLFSQSTPGLWNYASDEAVRKILVSAGKDLDSLLEAARCTHEMERWLRGRRSLIFVGL